MPQTANTRMPPQHFSERSPASAGIKQSHESKKIDFFDHRLRVPGAGLYRNRASGAAYGAVFLGDGVLLFPVLAKAARMVRGHKAIQK